MPIVSIEIRKQYSQDEEIALMKAVQSAIREAYQIVHGEIDVRLIVHEPHRFMCPPSKEHPELFTLISIDCFVGRSLDTKRTLYRTIVRNLEEVGVPKDHIKILIRESSKENWGLRGGQAACDIDASVKSEG